MAVVAGCTGGATASDPLSRAELRVSGETVGDAVAPGPPALVRGADGWIVPFRDGSDVHVRLVGDDGGRSDRLIDRGSFAGAARLDDGYAIAVAAADDGGAARVHFITGERDDCVTVPAPVDGGALVAAAASDGARVLLAATRGGEIAVEDPRPLDATLYLVSRDGTVRPIALGPVAAVPTLWGDAAGFVVFDGHATFTVDADGAVAPAPGRQIGQARLFRAPVTSPGTGTQPTRDRITVDGARWLDVDGLVGYAAAAGFEIVRSDGRQFAQVGHDLTPLVARALPSSARADGGRAWVAGAAGGRVVWAATQENDPVFAVLAARDDPPAMAADSPVIRLAAPSDRAIVVSPVNTAVLFAWIDERASVRLAVVQPDPISDAR